MSTKTIRIGNLKLGKKRGKVMIQDDILYAKIKPSDGSDVSALISISLETGEFVQEWFKPGPYGGESTGVYRGKISE